MGTSLKGNNLLLGSKFFLFSVGPFPRVASLENSFIHLLTLQMIFENYKRLEMNQTDELHTVELQWLEH